MTNKTLVANELEIVRNRHRGILRPRQVLAYARDKKTALHKVFEWDNSKAAEEYRLEQARRLIRCTVTVINDDKAPIHAYVSLMPDRRGGDSYRSLVEVMTDVGLREQLLAQALCEAESWRKRYERLAELSPIMRAIDKVQKGNGITTKRQKRRK